MKTFHPSGVVSLLTDFGMHDDYVGELHAVLYSVNSSARIVDICHDILPGDIEAAAFFLRHNRMFFPPGAVHVSVVDPGVGGKREILCAWIDGQVFIAPDNGLLDPLLDEADTSEVRIVKNSDLFRRQVSPTFHGRDIMVPVAARISAGMPVEKVGPVTETWVNGPCLTPRKEGRVLVGRVMWVDRFGNLITNLPSAVMADHHIQIAGVRPRLVSTFRDGNPGEPVCLIGGKDTVEVVINGGDAAKILGLGIGTVVKALPTAGE